MDLGIEESIIGERDEWKVLIIPDDLPKYNETNHPTHVGHLVIGRDIKEPLPEWVERLEFSNLFIER